VRVLNPVGVHEMSFEKSPLSMDTLYYLAPANTHAARVFASASLN
jgi:hypothetical protein